MSDERREASALPVSVWSGTIRIFGVELEVHVLSNGQRVIEADSVERFLRAMESDIEPETGELVELARFIQGRGVPAGSPLAPTQEGK